MRGCRATNVKSKSEKFPLLAVVERASAFTLTNTAWRPVPARTEFCTQYTGPTQTEPG